MAVRDAQPGEPPEGDYHGRPTRRLANEHLWLEVLADGGPRIVRLGAAGSTENLLAETPSAGWDTPNGRYELFGGHRLWFAPEDPDLVAVPDGSGLTLEVEPNGVRLVGRAEPATGLVRSIHLSLDPHAPVVELRHELCNVGHEAIELAPWSITQLPLGGIVILPQAAASVGHRVRPNRMLVLWPYTSWDDARFEPHDGVIVMRAEPGERIKLGYFNDHGWIGYVRAGIVLVRRFVPAIGRAHPDLGCNVEAFCGDEFLELEVLGPLTALVPGALVTQTEWWEIRPVPESARELVDEVEMAVRAVEAGQEV